MGLSARLAKMAQTSSSCVTAMIVDIPRGFCVPRTYGLLNHRLSPAWLLTSQEKLEGKR